MLLFVRSRYGVSPALGDVFFRFDPLVLLITSIAGRALVTVALPALVVVAATLVFGRFFCGYVCPLGTTIDISDVLFHRKTKPASVLRHGKFLLLLFIGVAALLGTSFLGFFDPLVIMERSLTLVFYPVASFLGGLVGNMKPAIFTDSTLALATFGLIIGLGLIAPRFWCRNLCPLGGLLGLLSKLSLFKFGFSPDCRDCGLCAKVCPTGAIAPTGNSKSSTGNLESKMAIDPAECINCLACRYRCADRSARYGFHPAPARLDLGRREAIISIGSAIVAAPLAASLLYRRTSTRLIRPPGALPEGEFLNTCLRCGRCMKACPTGALQPCLLESGVNGLWSPRVVPRVGGCEKNCNLCGQVCPTAAIRPLPLEEKSYARIGTAVIDRSRCIAWEQDRVCLVCDEACQYNAIGAYSETIRGTSLLRPFVDERICVGCGLCESRCPIDGPAAIQVHSFGEERKRTGSYKTGEKARLRTCGERTGSEDIPSGFILDDR